MTFEIGGRHEPNPVLQRALEILLVLHADHEQNCSTSAVRGVGSSHVDPFSAVSAGIAALYGPLHGGANEAVLRMLDEIGDVSRVPTFIEDVKAGKGRLMGFGHRVYKSYDPRAKLIKQVADDVFEQTGLNPKLEIALELERIALEDEYFVTRKLYPNVDFYSGSSTRRWATRPTTSRCSSRSAGCPAGSPSGRRCSPTRSRRSRGRGRSTSAPASGRMFRSRSAADAAPASRRAYSCAQPCASTTAYVVDDPASSRTAR